MVPVVFSFSSFLFETSKSMDPKDRLLDSPVEEDVYMEVALDLVLAH